MSPITTVSRRTVFSLTPPPDPHPVSRPPVSGNRPEVDPVSDHNRCTGAGSTDTTREPKGRFEVNTIEEERGGEGEGGGVSTGQESFCRERARVFRRPFLRGRDS